MSEEKLKLEKVEKKGDTKIGAVIVLVISAVVFLPAGGAAVYQGLFNKNKAAVYGSFNGEKVTYEPGTKFYNAVSNIAQRYQSYGMRIDESNTFYVMNEAFNETIQDMAFSSAVRAAGYSVPEDAVNREILPYFYDENGKFSNKLYNQTDSSRISDLRKNAEGGLLARRYYFDCLGTQYDGQFNGKAIYGLKTNREEQEFIKKMNGEFHKFVAATFDTADFPENEKVEFGKKNADKFVKHDISAITVDDESAAKEILKQIKSNEITFEDAVAEKSQKYYTNTEGKLSNPYHYQLSEMLDSSDDVEKLASLAAGSVSEVMKTKNGYSVFRTNGGSTAADFSDADTVKVVYEYMKLNEKGYIENYYINLASGFASGAALTSFDESCEKYGAVKSDVDAIPVNYNNSTLLDSSADAVFTALSKNAEAYAKVFKLGTDEISEPVVLGDKVIVFKCTDIGDAAHFGKTDKYADNKVNLEEADNTALASTLMKSSKVVNNFFTAYLSQMK